MKLLTNKQQKSYKNSKLCYIFKEKIEYIHCHYAGESRGAVQSICNLKYSVTKEIPIIFHNGSNYDYCFIIKELAEELIFVGKFIF